MNTHHDGARRAPAAMPRRTPVALAASTLGLLLLTGATPAHAQATAEAAAPTQTITISGIRASIESSLRTKREDRGIVDAITAEDIGKFPDTNLAESLQRIPGVVIDRDAGEGRNITVRGLGADFTRVRINGVEALATTGGTDSSGGANRSRGFDFNVFASELFKSVTVRKSASADVEEGSLGATVDLQTSRPFDFRGFTASASIRGRYNEVSGKTGPRLAFLMSNTTEDRRLGALVSVAYSERNIFEEGFSTVRWDNGASAGGWCAPTGVANNPANSTATTCGPAAQGVPRIEGTPQAVAAYNLARDPANFHPRLPRYGRLTHDQERLGVTGAVQWRPLDGSLLTFDLLYAKLKATRQEDFLQAISFSRTAAQGGKPQTSVLDTAYGPNGALLYGLYNGVDIRAESRFDRLSTEFTQPSLTLEQDLSERLRLFARIGTADSKFRNPQQTTTTLDALNVNGYSIDFRGNSRLPSIVYPIDVSQPGALGLVTIPQVASGTQPSTIANTTASEIRIRPQGANNRNDVATFHLDYELNENVNLKGGADYKRYKFDTYEFRRVNQNDTIFAPPAGTAIGSLTTVVSGFGKGLGLPAGAPTAWVIPDLQAIAAAYDIYCNCLKSGPVGGPGDFTLSSITNGNARGNNRRVTEENRSVWAMADFSTRLFGLPLRGNAGVRWVETEQLATGFQAAGGGTEVSVPNKYTDTLPSVNLSANITDDFIVRLAAAKVMARPQLGNLNPGGSVSTTGNLTINSGNPTLKPFRATTLDASFEWYRGRNAFVGLGLFHKDISTYIQSLRVTVPFRDTGLPLSLLPANFTGDEVFALTTPVNTDGGKLSGFEINVQQPFSFLPGRLSNMGVLLNYTRVQSKIDYVTSPTNSAVIRDDLLNLSPESWNASLYYDDGTFSARLSASSRSGFLTRVPGQNNNDVEGKNGSTNFDLSFGWKVTPQLELTFEGVNLANTANDQFISRARDSVVVYHKTGREFLVGARYRF